VVVLVRDWIHKRYFLCWPQGLFASAPTVLPVVSTEQQVWDGAVVFQVFELSTVLFKILLLETPIL